MCIHVNEIPHCVSTFLQLADKFMTRCAESIQKVSQIHQLPWEVTLCGWSLDDEEERVVRSQVVGLLRRYSPYYWTKWNTFKQKYSEVYGLHAFMCTVRELKVLRKKHYFARHGLIAII